MYLTQIQETIKINLQYSFMPHDKDKEPPLGESKEYLEQLAIEAIARIRYPETRIREILPGFDAGENNYVWLVILETDKPFENTITTVDTNDIRAWKEQQNQD